MSRYIRQHVMNTTDKPMVDFFDGKPVIFQPDQEKRQGTYGLRRVPRAEKDLDVDEPHTDMSHLESEPSLDMKAMGDTMIKLVKVSDDLASNVVACPPGYVESNLTPAEVKRGGVRHGLVVVENHLDIMEGQIASKSKQLAALSAQQGEVEDLVASLQAAAAEADNPLIAAALEKAAGIRNRMYANDPEPVMRRPEMPEAKRGKKRA
jgi:hypothetical protein